MWLVSANLNSLVTDVRPVSCALVLAPPEWGERLGYFCFLYICLCCGQWADMSWHNGRVWQPLTYFADSRIRKMLPPQYSPMWQAPLVSVAVCVTLTRGGEWRLMDSVAIMQPLVSNILCTTQIIETSKCTQIVTKLNMWCEQNHSRSC